MFLAFALWRLAFLLCLTLEGRADNASETAEGLPKGGAD
jgi:hypothetical protein